MPGVNWFGLEADTQTKVCRTQAAVTLHVLLQTDPWHSTHLEGSIYVTIEFKLGGIMGKNGMRRRPTQNIHDFINYLHI